jgi:gliding-associated putative ABC transporter substrate-binding component GldG
MSKKSVNKRTQSLLQLALFAGILIFVNILGNAFYTHLDLTEEKRFTLTKATGRLLENLDDVVYVNVLLDGEFPAGFKRLQTATREMLEDFRAGSGYIEYQFEDPGLGTVDEINSRREELEKDGIRPINLRLKSNDETTEKLIYPYAMFYYKGRQMVVNLLENEVPGVPPEVTLNNSVSLLEYKFANAIQKLQTSRKPIIAFTDGHGELDDLETRDWEKSLRQFYDTGRLKLDSLTQISPEVSILVVAKPRYTFSEQDKFKIDQYVMNGGKIIWLLDALRVDLDSLRTREEYFALDYQLNLDDLLFKYGIRLQPNLVLDMQCSRIPLATGVVGNAPQFDYFRYPYHLVVTPKSDHPIVKSLGVMNLLYPSTVDTTVRLKTDVTKTVLLESSANTRVQFAPVGLNFEFLRYDLDPAKFNKEPQPLAMILEGEFPSAYTNKVSVEMKDGLAQLGQEFKSQSTSTKMLVVSDGDIAKNPINRAENSHGPLGYNQFEKYQFANKDFLVNAIEYLMDDNGVIEARGKEVKLRLLDTVKAQAEETKWQLINIVLPLVFLILFGFAYTWLRKKRFAA